MQKLLTCVKWVVFFIFYLIALVSTYILSPVLPLFAIGKERLPKWLTWFQTPNAPLDGDRGYQYRYTWLKCKYGRRVMWLIRNPAGGFCWSPIGYYIEAGTKVTFKGTKNVNETTPGWQLIATEDDKCLQFRFYSKPYNFFGTKKLVKFRVGWKMRYLANNEVATGDLVKFCFTGNPFRTFPEK